MVTGWVDAVAAHGVCPSLASLITPHPVTCNQGDPGFSIQDADHLVTVLRCVERDEQMGQHIIAPIHT